MADGSSDEAAGDTADAQVASQEFLPAGPRPRDVFYSLTLGAGFSHNSTSGEYVRFSMWKPGTHGITLDLGEQHGGGESSVAVGATYWRNLDPKTSLSLSGGGGSAPFAPRYALGASIGRPFFDVGFTFGAGYKKWHDDNYVTEIGVGAQRWFPHWIVGGGATYSQGEPASFTGWRGGVGLTYFVWRKTYASVSIDFGKVRNRDWNYDVRGKGLNFGFSQYFNSTSGISVSAGRSLDIDTYGVSVSVFKEW